MHQSQQIIIIIIINYIQISFQTLTQIRLSTKLIYLKQRNSHPDSQAFLRKQTEIKGGGRIRIRTCFRRASHELGISIVLQTIWNFLVQRDLELELELLSFINGRVCLFGDEDRSSTFLNGNLDNSFWA